MNGYDKRIDPDEHAFLLAFFNEFVSILDSKAISSQMTAGTVTVGGICAVCPEISFDGSVFCFTGESHKYTREEFQQIVTSFGGRSVRAVSCKVHYLVIGAEGNPAWAYACYGRKIEQAMQLRKEGHQILIVNELDFHDAVLDQ